MRQLLFLSAGFVGVSLSCAACQAKLNDSVSNADSLNVIEEDILPQSFLNPDTCFASIQDLVYKVDTFDTIHSGVIQSIDGMYEPSRGIFTFRGNPERTAVVYELDRQPDSLYVDWTFVTKTDNRKTSHGSWGGGTGWTGQPLFVEWPDSLVSYYKSLGTMNAEAGNREVIFASLCSQLYFLDLATGKPSREPIFVNHPIKGTPMVDPLLNGLIYVGQGVKACSAPWGQIFVDLKKHAVVKEFGEDRKAWRPWGAYDSSPIRLGQFVFRPGENGTLYKWLVEGDTIILHSTLRYKMRGAAPGIESSMSVWRNYGYLNDNHGNVVCVNLNTMKPVWRYDNYDDCDSTPLVSYEGDNTYIYSGCEVDRKAGAARCHFVKLDALTGAKVWEDTTASRQASMGGKHFDGGYYATPLLGKGVCEDLVFANRVLNTRNMNGELVAFEKATGRQRYTVALRHYAWSSPIGFVSPDGKFTIFTADTAGNVYLIDGESGKILYRQLVGSNFESSPIAVGNSVLLGSRGNKFFKMNLVSK